MGNYTEEEFQQEFVDERTLDEEYEVDSRSVQVLMVVMITMIMIMGMMVMMMNERTLDEEYEIDSRRVAHVEECSGV